MRSSFAENQEKEQEAAEGSEQAVFFI